MKINHTVKTVEFTRKSLIIDGILSLDISGIGSSIINEVECSQELVEGHNVIHVAIHVAERATEQADLGLPEHELREGEFIVLTKEIIQSVKDNHTPRGCFSGRQFGAVGLDIHKLSRGWSRTLIGKKITKEAFERLKNY
jgi:hypothetical protein